MSLSRSLPAIAGYALDPQEAAPANRAQWSVDASRAVVLVHDMQRYFVEAFDRSDAAAQINVAVRRIAALTSAARERGIPVVYTAQPPDQSADDRGLLTDFWGQGLTDDGRQEVIGELAPQPEDAVLTKWRYSAFARTDLGQRMRGQGRDQLLITGVYAHIGCLTTALVAFMADIKPFMVADALADFSLAEHRQALAHTAGRCGQVIATGTVLEQLQTHRRPVSAAAGR